MSVHLLAVRPEDIQALNLWELEAKMIKLIWYLIPKLLGTRWHLLMNNNPHRAVQVITVIFLLLLYSVHRLWLDLLDPKERGWVTPIAINVEVAAAWSDARAAFTNAAYSTFLVLIDAGSSWFNAARHSWRERSNWWKGESDQTASSPSVSERDRLEMLSAFSLKLYIWMHNCCHLG